MNASPTKKIISYMFFLFVYVGLPLLILMGFISFNLKFHALTVGAVAVYLFCRYIGFSNKDLGITLEGAKKSVIYVLPITAILAAIGILLWILGFSRITPNENWYFFVFYIFISSPFQEFLYRGALEAFMDKAKYRYLSKMVITSLLYSFVHIIYRDMLTLVLTFLIGLIWYYCYEKKKSLVGVSLSHAVLGLVTIIAGVIN